MRNCSRINKVLTNGNKMKDWNFFYYEFAKPCQNGDCPVLTSFLEAVSKRNKQTNTLLDYVNKCTL